MRFPLAAAAAAALVLLVAPAARSAGPLLIVGAAEDDVKAGTLAEAKARLDLLSLAGLQAVRVTAIWDPADPHPTADMLLALNNLTAAAKLDAIDVFVSVSTSAAGRPRSPTSSRRASPTSRPSSPPGCRTSRTSSSATSRT
jgi:hypothetical protein